MTKLFNFCFLLILYPCYIKAGGSYSDLHPTSPERSVIANLFEWRFDDIAEECETFLGPYGYAAVQVSPVLEYAVLNKPYYEPAAVRPWYERYQPVSYKIISRSGDEAAFTNMVDRCNKAGVRVIVDLVLNHMTGAIDGVGTGGSTFKGQSDKSYPGVPYDQSHFNSKEKCGTSDGSIQDYNNPSQVRNCELSGLHDLDNGNEHVRQVQSDAINRLIDIGVAGFRMDASKHIWPGDLKAIFDRVHNLNTAYFPENSRPILCHEVQPGGAVTMAEYTPLGRVLEFNYRSSIVDVFRGNNGQKLRWLKNFGEGWNFVKSGDAVPMIDNHDLQRSDVYKGINFRSSRLYKLATAFMLAWPYGVPNVMSSYDWPTDMQGDTDKNKYMGPPADDQQNIKHVIRKSDLSCEAPWVCEHRFKPIYSMVKFRAVAGNEPVANWWDNANNAIAFSRGSKAFIFINNEPNSITQTFQTSLPGGTYCDIITGDKKDDSCTGKTVKVDSSGKTTLTVDGSKDETPIIAIHVDAKIMTTTISITGSSDKSESHHDKAAGDKAILDHCAVCIQSLYKRKVDL
ncbi:alpha-amylase 2 [Tetranychus urticae]|uniref:Alpha-amylase n=1 Tax=Tetranychus urticae TaxID=32264 RepID=T1KHM3_TETUR|nr:alpha-amylase 2 [Tetranychus urticae]